MAIAIGGVLGATVRWLVTRQDDMGGGWFAYEPNTSIVSQRVLGMDLGLGTLVVNVFGCLLLGGLTVLLARSTAISRRALLAASTGFCGSLTTFSGFAVEVAALLRGQPVLPRGVVFVSFGGRSTWHSALLYLGLSLLGGAIAFALGRAAIRRALPPATRTTDGET